MKKHIGVLTVVAILCLFLIVGNVAAQGGVASYLVMIANQAPRLPIRFKPSRAWTPTSRS